MEEEVLNEEQNEALDTKSVEETGEELEKIEENASDAPTLQNEIATAQSPEKTTLPEENGGKEDKISALDEEIKSLKAQLELERQKRVEGENRLFCIEALEKRGLPRSLSEFLTGQSNEETEKRVDRVSEIIKSSVNDEVSKRLSSLPQPQKSRGTMTKSSFKNLSLEEMQSLYKTDKTLYMTLAKK
ncbi:MAG: DUF4355 domain-containing protein [Clostridia bacterium]|nr:DUF4355 domain-containing protein [Clostridia bacterium]